MIPLLPRVDCVLFDLDGTLVETNIDFPLMKREIIALAAGFGLDPVPLADLDILSIVDRAQEKLIELGREGDARQLRERALATLEEIEVRHAQDTEQIPFARETVAELQSRKIPVGIVTRNCRKASRISLDMVDITPDLLVCREDTAKHKPHPDPFAVALGILGARANDSVMVGDHIMDVAGGKAAGMKTIGFLRASRPDDFFEQVAPDLIARDLREVLDAIIDRDR